MDTPGIGSIHSHNTEQTLRYLPQADAVLTALAVDQPAGEAELDSSMRCASTPTGYSSC